MARSPGGKRFANALLPNSVAPLSFPVTLRESTAYAETLQGLIEGSARQLAKELKTTGTASEDFISKYLRENSLTKLTGGFSETSVDRLRGAIADAWDQGGSYNQIVAAVQDTFEQFSTVRAGMISQTEVNSAYNASRMDMADTLGMEEKAWDPDGTECCDVCQENVDAGWIPIDEDFPSGDDAATAHPGCDCSTDFRKGA